MKCIVVMLGTDGTEYRSERATLEEADKSAKGIQLLGWQAWVEIED